MLSLFLICVLPSLAVHDLSNRAPGDIKFARKLRTSTVAGSEAPSNLVHLMHGEDGAGVCFTCCGSSPRGHLRHIFGMRAGVKVTGVDAGALIATVQNLHTRRDRADEQFIRNAMRACLDASDTQVAVTACVQAPKPRPAEIVVSLQRELPEAWLNFFGVATTLSSAHRRVVARGVRGV